MSSIRCLKQVTIIATLILASPTVLQAQWLADSLLVSALQSRTGGPGGCWDRVDTMSVSSPFFPGIHFLQGACIAEHGTPYGAVVATDSSGVLYLLGDGRDAVHFLFDRHPVTATLGDSARLDLATFILLLIGESYPHTIRLDSVGALPKPAYREFNPPDLTRRSHVFGDSIQPVAFVVTSTPTYRDEVIEYYEVFFARNRFVFVDSIRAWVIPPVSRFIHPRNGPDSVLVLASRAVSTDYGANYASGVEKEVTGLSALFDLTPSLSDSARVLHIDVLWDLETRWGDRAFTRALRSRPVEVQRTVRQQMFAVLDPNPSLEGLKELAGLTRSLGLLQSR